jgi:UbiD family decarboxylase
LQRCKARGCNLEVAVVIGVHPANNLAAAARMAMEVDECEIAGGLLAHPIELVKCKTIDVEVPAQAEIRFEGTRSADVVLKELRRLVRLIRAPCISDICET